MDLSSCESVVDFKITHDPSFSDLSEKIIGLTSTMSVKNFYINHCDDLSVLSGYISQFKDLTKIDLSNCIGLSSINFTAGNASVTTIDVNGCVLLSEISSLSNFTSLTTLIAYNTSLSSLEELRNNTVITYLNINNTKINSLEPLTNVTSLTEIYANNCSIVSLQGVEKLVNLKTLELSNNSIVNLYYLDKLRIAIGGGTLKLTNLNLASNLLVNSDVIIVDGAYTPVNNIAIINSLYDKGLHNIDISGNNTLDKSSFAEKNGIKT